MVYLNPKPLNPNFLVFVLIIKATVPTTELLGPGIRNSTSARGSAPDFFGLTYRGIYGVPFGDLIQGSLKGSTQGSLKGSTQGSLKGSIQGSLKGSIQGSLKGSTQGSFSGSTQGSLKGSTQGFF